MAKRVRLVKLSSKRMGLLATMVRALCCLSPSVSAAEAGNESCAPDFPFKDGWWGADAAYFIPLPDGRIVWVFGDTLYGKERVVKNKIPRMVRNSIAISTCDADGNWNVEYVMRGADTGQPQDFFQARDGSYWYWALDGFFHGEDLWVTLLCIREAAAPADPDSEVFTFETCGTDLAKLSNLDAPPEEWPVKYFPLVPDGTRAHPSATAVVEGDYAYIFGVYEEGGRPMVLARIPLDGLEAPADNLEYLASDDTWKPGFDPTRAKHVMERGVTEMSVRYHPGLKKWIALLGAPEFPSDKVLFRTAPRLTGPWTEGKVVYQFPDMQRTAPAYDKDTFCYAVKEHPEFRKPGEILITYVCNTFTVAKIVDNLTIYFPRPVRLPLPEME